MQYVIYNLFYQSFLCFVLEPIDVSSELFDKKCVQFGYISDGHVPDVTGTEVLGLLTYLTGMERSLDDKLHLHPKFYNRSLARFVDTTIVKAFQPII